MIATFSSNFALVLNLDFVLLLLMVFVRFIDRSDFALG